RLNKFSLFAYIPRLEARGLYASQLVKTSLDKALIDCLVPSLWLGMPTGRLCLPYLRQQPNEERFQPEAGNKVLKEFLLKLTPMNAVAPLQLNLYFSYTTLNFSHQLTYLRL
ncbi:MAG: hypothetical protein RM347_019805, partial [Nostoc sp. ChiQUE02]|uniref:hypothetical protein n=1 Tax=Nostoc sp. ChiQUE02 TaxID=3075377 RepID=UPI003D1617DB